MIEGGLTPPPEEKQGFALKISLWPMAHTGWPAVGNPSCLFPTGYRVSIGSVAEMGNRGYRAAPVW